MVQEALDDVMAVVPRDTQRYFNLLEQLRHLMGQALKLAETLQSFKRMMS
jgi:hypothetical protein